MEKHYSRLNESERVTIMVMRLKGSSMSEIAKRIEPVRLGGRLKQSVPED